MHNRYLGRFLLFSFSLLVSLILAELIVRVLASQNVNIRFLSTAGASEDIKLFATLEDFLQSKSAHMQPNRLWFNYYANALGFNDREFEPKKAPDEVRIASLGDSFCYGLVSYPLNAQTLIEDGLKRRCSKNINLFNMGVPASGVWEYKTLMDLTEDRYNFDSFIIHFYAGNDAPDLLHINDDIPKWKMPRFHLYLPTIIANVVRLKQLTESQPMPPAANNGPRIGGMPTTPDAKPLTSPPHYNAAGFQEVLNDEMGRFYVDPKMDKKLRKYWGRVYEVLGKMVEKARNKHKKVIIVLYPSRLQLEEETRMQTIAVLKEQNPNLTEANFDMALPQRMMREFCVQEDIPCKDIADEMRLAQGNSTEPLYISMDPHWNELGNSIAAQIEERFLAQEICPDSGIAEKKS